MRNRTRTVIWKAAAALAAVITVGACSGSPQVRSFTLTFIRHAESIKYWTMMNVKNPKNSLATSHRLPNLGRVVITGSPALGWTLVDWDGIRDFSY